MGKIAYLGNIITMEDAIKADVVIIQDGIISNVGYKKDLSSLIDDETQVIDLGNSTLMPSFIDSHSHIISYASTLELVDLSNAYSLDEIKEKFDAFIMENSPAENDWIIGFGYDNNVLPGSNHPTIEFLNSISTKSPVAVTHKSGHIGVINSKGLELCKITNETPTPEGGFIGHFENGQPNGYFEENAFFEISSQMSIPDFNKLCELTCQAQDIYLKNGITTIQEGFLKEKELKILKSLSQQNKLTADIVGYVDLKNTKEILSDNKEYFKKYNNGFKIGGYKIFLDGSPQGKTAWISKPYFNDKDNTCGYPIYSDEEVENLCKISIDEKTQLLAHCNGDMACQQYIKNYTKALGNEQSKLRPVMIHAQLLTENQILEMKPINMIPSFFITHTYYWGDTHIRNFGIERASKISPAKTALEKGLVYTFHQDTPVIYPNLLDTVQCAVIRKTKSGVLLGESEKLDVYNALKAITINAAYSYFEEDTKGSIKVGKVADLVILDENPLECNINKIKEIKVLETIKNGKTVYRAKK